MVTYNERIENDFYTTYSKYLSEAALNGVTASLILDSLKDWFGKGHLAGVNMMIGGVKEYKDLLNQYGRHTPACPQFNSFPATCTCGWEEITRKINAA